MKLLNSIATLIFATTLYAAAQVAAPRDIGSSRHLWVDDQLVESKNEAMEYRLHHPRVEGPFPTQPSGYYMTILREDDGLLRAYYRKYLQSIYGAADDEFTAYAESRDGVTWEEPRLGLVRFENDPDQNAILWKIPEIPWPGICHNFSPFIDHSPDCPPEERYKAVAGTPTLGLWAFTSPDGFHWQAKTPAILPKTEVYAFDSHNVALYNTQTKQYELYYRAGQNDRGETIRTVWKTTTQDFSQWNRGAYFGPNFPDEQIYTLIPNQYFRAPDYLICFPTRYIDGRGSATDILFMTSWRGQPIERLHRDAIIRPGPLPEAWGNRRNYISRGLIPVGDREVAVYENLNRRRFVWRLDGFSSLHAGADTAELVTRPFTFQGKSLTINAETSAIGGIRLEFLDEAGKPIPGFTLDEAVEFVGDQIDHPMAWKGQESLEPLAGRPVRLHILMNEADFYSFKFE